MTTFTSVAALWAWSRSIQLTRRARTATNLLFAVASLQVSQSFFENGRDLKIWFWRLYYSGIVRYFDIVVFGACTTCCDASSGFTLSSNCCYVAPSRTFKSQSPSQIKIQFLNMFYTLPHFLQLVIYYPYILYSIKYH